MALPGWMNVDPILTKLARWVLTGSRSDVSVLAEMLEKPRSWRQTKRVLRFLRWSAAHGQELAGELAEPFDRRMALATGVAGTERSRHGELALASSCISVLPLEPPSALRIKWLLALVGWRNPQDEWPNEQWSRNRHAAQALLRLDKAFGPLIDDSELLARIQAIAGPDPEDRWAAVIDLADLRISDKLKSRFRELTFLGAGQIPPDETVPRCPVCRRSSLSYAQISSPPETWQKMCGREWLVRFCGRCRVIVWDKVIRWS